MVCTLGRHLSELSFPCLFTNVLECLLRTAIGQEATRGLRPCRDGDSKGTRPVGESAIRVTPTRCSRAQKSELGSGKKN